MSLNYIIKMKRMLCRTGLYSASGSAVDQVEPLICVHVDEKLLQLAAAGHAISDAAA